ncbi:hypothetical protein [Pedobacter metabolipauper]|uniref:hypothetical protein n=1 Tax=Pedobacter metabolipauper TaxID=425513 RepID=UPI0010608A0B|nr:hypothetical protein [Pedobacter metabolipauper]
MKKIFQNTLLIIAPIIASLNSDAITVVYGTNSPGPAPVYECGGGAAFCIFIQLPIFSSPLIQDESTMVNILELAFLRYD